MSISISILHTAYYVEVDSRAYNIHISQTRPSKRKCNFQQNKNKIQWPLILFVISSYFITNI